MFCSNCGEQNPDGAAFCRKCGQVLRAAQPKPENVPPQASQSPDYQSQSPDYQSRGQYNQPQSQYNQPKDQYGNSQNPNNQPQSQYNQPQGQYNQPRSPYNQMQNPYRPSAGASVNGPMEAMRTVAKSPMFLTAVILFTSLIVLNILSAVTGVNSVISYLVRLLDQYQYEIYSATDLDVNDLYPYIRAMSGTSVVNAIVAQFFPILVTVGLWMTWASARQAEMKSTGLSIIKVIYIIRMVFYCIGMVIMVIACGIMGFAFKAIAKQSYSVYETALYGKIGNISLFGLFVALICFGISIFVWVKLIGSISAGVKAINGDKTGKCSMLIVVLLFISAIITLISGLISAVMAFNLFTLLTSILTAVDVILFALVLTKARKELQNADSRSPVSQPIQSMSQYGQPQQPVQPRPQYGQPQQPVQPMSQYGQPQQPVQPMSQYGQPQQSVQPMSQYGQPQQPVQPMEQPVQPMEQPVQPMEQPVQSQQSMTPLSQQEYQPEYQPAQEEAETSGGNLYETVAYVPSVPEEVPENEPEIPQASLHRIRTDEVLEISQVPYIIGKGSQVNLNLADNVTVSRRHAEIVWDDGCYWVIDLNSKNHTYVNDHMISSDEMVQLSHGTSLKFSDEEFIFLIG